MLNYKLSNVIYQHASAIIKRQLVDQHGGRTFTTLKLEAHMAATNHSNYQSLIQFYRRNEFIQASIHQISYFLLIQFLFLVFILRLSAHAKEDILVKSQDVRNERKTRFNHQAIRWNRKELGISNEIGREDH